MNQSRAQLLILLASTLLGFGLFSSCLTITPSAGEWTGVLKIFKPDFTTPKELSLVGGIRQLFEHGFPFIGGLILIFSIAFPLWKLGVLWAASWATSHGEHPRRLLKLVEKLGKYSMLDVLVIALLVVAIKGLPGGTAVTLGPGFYCFAVSVLLALGLPSIVRSASKRE